MLFLDRPSTLQYEWHISNQKRRWSTTRKGFLFSRVRAERSPRQRLLPPATLMSEASAFLLRRASPLFLKPLVSLPRNTTSLIHYTPMISPFALDWIWWPLYSSVIWSGGETFTVCTISQNSNSEKKYSPTRFYPFDLLLESVWEPHEEHFQILGDAVRDM